MKKCLLIFPVMLAFGLSAFAQKSDKKPEGETQREIIIRNNDGTDKDLHIQFKNNAVTINGKNIAEFNDSSITVRDRKIMWRNGNDATWDMSRFFYNFDEDNSEAASQTYLGVGLKENSKGAEVSTVVENSAAKKAGLKPGDVITSVNDTKVASPGDLTEAVEGHKPGDIVTINYLRSGKKANVKATLGERKVSNSKQMIVIGPNGERNEFRFPQTPKAPRVPGVPALPSMPNLQFNFDEDGNGAFLNREAAQGEKLGIKVEDLEKGSGVKIIDVETGSKAEKAGLKVGDIITEVDGSKIRNTTDARINLTFLRFKDTFKMKILRNEKEEEVTIPRTIRTAEL